MNEIYKFEVEECVRKCGGSYQAEGVIKARFLADDGTPRYVFRFDSPPGLLHIFNEKQLESCIQPKDYIEDEDDNEPSILEKIRNKFGI
jgi:hypothetical protein